MTCKKILSLTVILGCILAAGTSRAAETSAGAGVSAGQGGAMAYTLQVKQTYEPWLSGSVGELKPMAELGGFAWVDDDDTVWGAFLAPGLMFTLFTDASFRPFLGASVGGAAISEDKLDTRDLGSHFLFRTKGSVGVEFGAGLHHRVQGEYVNYSNWGISDRDDGFNTYGLSYGYSF